FAGRGRSTMDGDGAETRVAFRVTAHADDRVNLRLNVEPVIQKRGRGGMFSKGSRLEWFNLPGRSGLTPVERRAYQAYEDRFAREAHGGRSWGRLTGAHLFGILRALIDHPAVFLDTVDRGPLAQDRAPAPVRATLAESRLELRQGRMRLRFATATDGGVTPFFELLGVSLSPTQADNALASEEHVVCVHRPPGQPPQILLAQITPQAAAVVHALALAPAQFPADAHDALATRLESLQEAVDIDFPSHWTRTIGPADGRLVARLELLGSGAVQLRLRVRPVKLGPVFPPGEGPVLVLEGQGRDRHGARRDPQMERQQGHALTERLGLGGGEEVEAWCWRVGEGDPALQLVDSLKELSEASGDVPNRAADDLGETAGTPKNDVAAVAAGHPDADATAAPAVVVEWADDQRLIALGSVGRGDMRMKVADRRDWFGLEGGAAVKRAGKGKKPGGGPEAELVPLADLLAAIREERRYVRVGSHGFVRIEQTLRDALARAEGAVFAHGDNLQISSVAHDALMGLVEAEAQLEASAGFAALRRRMREGADLTPRLTAELEKQLRPYQKAGVEWMTRLSHWGAGAILADEMGLGKTIQTLGLLLHRASEGPALVVAPKSVVGNWVDEAARFVPALKVRLYRGAGRETSLNGLGPGDLVVTSYAIATLDAEGLARHRFASLVLDEAQAIKNASTERAKALRGLNADWRLGLTGTPIENHLGELWSLLRVISPGLLGSWEQFRGRYAVPIEKFGDQARRKSLSALLHPFMLRRMKSEVARDLPPRTEIVKTISLSDEEQKLYEELRLATLEEIASKKKDPDRDGQDLRFVLLAALTRLRQLCCHPRLVYPRTHAGSTKATYLVRLLDELREDGHKALVFSQFRSFLDLLEPRLTQHGFRVLVLDGTTPAEAREKRIAAFQAGEGDVFLISLKAGGFGLNLTAADTVIHLDPWWNPAVEDQATARAHRMGQQRPVTAVRLVARGTIEEAVLSLHAAKRALASAVLEGTDIAASLGTEELVDLIRRAAPAS
ncbi:MAG: DEAD/DEAH box helicase, partial [Polyangia bacterium]